MVSDQIIQKVRALADQVVTREGCQLYEIEFQGRSLCVYIDRDQEGGASIDDCANVSRGLNLLLDVDDPIAGGAYNLEVSTPGLERILRQPWHFQKVVGKKIWLKTSRTLESFGVQSKKWALAKTLSENLSAVTDEGVQIQLGEEQVSIPFAEIEKANLVFEMEEKGKVLKKPGKPAKKKK